MSNIDILTHFDVSTHASGISVYKLKEAERATFLSKLLVPYRVLYISDEDLAWRFANLGSSRIDEIAEKIPDDPVLMSGEFSEILCFYLIPEKYSPHSNLRPSKWKWKEAKNIPAHFTDVVVFHQIDPLNPNKDDSIIAMESKARASRPASTESSIQKAINDAQKDYVSRLGESLFHIKTKYKDDKDAISLKKLERFMDVARFPTFVKHFKAVATVDDAFAETHISNISAIPSNIRDTFEVILIRIENLKDGYEYTFTNMRNT